jgi:hypothetical protein
VVAVGVNAHFVQEFSRARQRVLCFLAQHRGFTMFAFEFGFSEAFSLDQWLYGEGDEAAWVGFTLADARLDQPGPGSVEAALVNAGLGDRISLADLRSSPGDPDALSSPTVTRDASVRF